MSRARVPWQRFQQDNGNEVRSRINMDDLQVLIWTWTRTWHRPSSKAGWYHAYIVFSLLYFPMQKSLKIMSRISSAPTRPVIRPRLVRASRTPSAARARSTSRYRWYWARAARHCCRWALWRAWVKLGAPTRGSAQLQEVEMTSSLKKSEDRKTKLDINVFNLGNVWFLEALEQALNVKDSQISDAAVQHCEEVLQAVISVTGDQTNRRESRDPLQLPVQVLPLKLRQQVSFIQHEENAVRRKHCRNRSGTGDTGNTLITLGLTVCCDSNGDETQINAWLGSSYLSQAALGGTGHSPGGAGGILQPLVHQRGAEHSRPPSESNLPAPIWQRIRSTLREGGRNSKHTSHNWHQ